MRPTMRLVLAAAVAGTLAVSLAGGAASATAAATAGPSRVAAHTAIVTQPPFPFDEFHAVPRLGDEPVRGTGCGSNGQLANVIPDGLWAGYASVDGGAVEIDVQCVFTPEAAATVLQQGTANIINPDPSYLVVNNSTNLRVMPTAPGVVLGDGALTVDGRCVAGPQTRDHSVASDRQAWVEIAGGSVTWILWGCRPLSITNPDGPPANPAGGLAPLWPYGPFWNVPQLGAEPVRGSGCGASGQIGDVIPDGLWAGYVTAYDPNTGTIGINLLCIFSGATAQTVIAQGSANIVSNEPDYLIVNNNERVRSMPNALSTIVVGRVDATGTCVEGEHLSPEEVGQFPARYGQQAWISIDGGAVSWVFYGCG